jgi:hypothetical protein
MKVAVYFNLHKKTFSIKALEGANKGRVIDYSDDVTIENAMFKVSQAGRNRVLQEKRNNVHAYVIGELKSTEVAGIVGEKVTYNPYLYSTFVTAMHKTPMLNAKEVFLICRDKKAQIFAR